MIASEEHGRIPAEVPVKRKAFGGSGGNLVDYIVSSRRRQHLRESNQFARNHKRERVNAQRAQMIILRMTYDGEEQEGEKKVTVGEGRGQRMDRIDIQGLRWSGSLGLGIDLDVVGCAGAKLTAKPRIRSWGSSDRRLIGRWPDLAQLLKEISNRILENKWKDGKRFVSRAEKWERRVVIREGGMFCLLGSARIHARHGHHGTVGMRE